MALDASGTWHPGPNDHHVAALSATDRPVIQPGLGKDEPDGRAVERLRNGEQRMKLLQERLNGEAKALETKQTEMEKKTRELELREMELAEREKRLASVEAESKKK